MLSNRLLLAGSGGAKEPGVYLIGDTSGNDSLTLYAPLQSPITIPLQVTGELVHPFIPTRIFPVHKIVDPSVWGTSIRVESATPGQIIDCSITSDFGAPAPTFRFGTSSFTIGDMNVQPPSGDFRWIVRLIYRV